MVYHGSRKNTPQQKIGFCIGSVYKQTEIKL